MTTFPRYRGVEEILRCLRQVHLRRRIIRLVTYLAMLISLVSASLVTATLAGGYWPDQPPAVLRWALWGLCLGLWVLAATALLARAAIWRQNPAQTARFVEQSTGRLRNNLINAVLLADDCHQVSGELVQKAIDETVRMSRTRSDDLYRSVSLRWLARWWIVAAVAGMAAAAVGIAQPGPFRRGVLAALTPWKYVPYANTMRGVRITPGDATIFAGRPIRVVVHLPDMRAGETARQLGKLNPRVLVAGRDSVLGMLGGKDGTFTCDLGPVEQTLRYAVVIGENHWPENKPYYRLTVIRRIDLKALDLTYTYPSYTHLKPQTVTGSGGNIEAPTGSNVVLTLRLSRGVPQAALEVKDEPSRAMAASEDRKTFAAELLVQADGGYRLAMRDESGRVIQRLPDLGSGDQVGAAQAAAAGTERLLDGYYPIRTMPDAPPRVNFLLPARDLTVAPGDKVRMKIKASDKFGLANVTLLAGTAKVHPASVLVRNPVGATETIIEYEYTVDPNLPDDGSVVIEYHATATDNRQLPALGLGSQSSRSRTFKITVQDAVGLAAEAAKRYEQLRKKLLAILELQLIQRVSTAICWTKHTKLGQIRDTGVEILVGQKAVRNGVLWLLTNHKFDQDMLVIRQELAQLSANEAKAAIDQAQVLTDLGALSERFGACHKLAATQDSIINALQSMLAIMPELAGREGQARATEGTDMPPEVAEKIRRLKTKLEQFIDAQKKVIQASGRLVKTPVDSFQDADEKLLKELRLTQDKWEKFIDEAFTDFSKLAQQDFSNGVLLKELLSVKCDVTMAKDALSKKAVEIATSAEDNAVENARTLTTNLEKWLPDTPDRDKWVMEDPSGGQENIEMPELPSELEDLVGDLLEQEEDLFDEMQDISAKATGSFDKGAGWDAMDGPISSMNAQGVTGNQLPNSSEIHGRSGEGRQGKSTGEFVEDKAVGKGGRRTPTRLTPEPFQKGQVDDRSPEPPGGSTGGGKISGAGAEGLEGPVPPELQKQLNRLAGRQAILINKAQRIRAQFKVSDHANLKLLKAVTLMNRVYGDLRQYRYHNALRRRREVVAAIQDSGLLLSGKVQVDVDATAAMPKYIRDDIADAMNGSLPEEFREVLKQYYRRLSENGSEK
jgi:hypothetical protein